MTARIVPSFAACGVLALLAPACTVTASVGTGSDASTSANNATPEAGTSGDAGALPDAVSGEGAAPGDSATGGDEATGNDASSGNVATDDAATTGNGCSDPPSSNQTAATATPLTIGTAVRACLRSGTDLNYYSYTVPTSPVKGGYVIVKVSDVDIHNTIDLTSQPASDGATLAHSYDVNAGGGTAQYFAAKPGATFRAIVKNWVPPSVSSPATAYTLTVTFTGINDPSAPNGTVATAAKLTPGTPAQGYFFAGYDSSATPPASAWESWYKVTLTPGTATVALTNVPGDAAGDVGFFDSNTNSIASHYNLTDGANVQFDAPVAQAGDYYVRVTPFTTPQRPVGTTPTVPTWMTQAWSLTVTVK